MSFQDHAEALGRDAPRKMLKSRFGKAALAGAIILLSICKQQGDSRQMPPLRA